MAGGSGPGGRASQGKHRKTINRVSRGAAAHWRGSATGGVGAAVGGQHRGHTTRSEAGLTSRRQTPQETRRTDSAETTTASRGARRQRCSWSD